MENLRRTDPEFMERFEHFAFEEVPNEQGQELDDEARFMAILAILLGCQGLDAFRVMLPQALDGGSLGRVAKGIDQLLLEFFIWHREGQRGPHRAMPDR